MSHEADDEQIEVMLVDECDDGLDRMTRKQMGLECHTGRLRLHPRHLDQRCQAMVCLGLFLVDLVDAGGKPRQLLDRHHVEGRAIPLRHGECRCQRAHRTGRAVVRHQDLPVHATNLLSLGPRFPTWLPPNSRAA
jgi:hypothetical protein